jgi:hypothetical protein
MLLPAAALGLNLWLLTLGVPLLLGPRPAPLVLLLAPLPPLLLLSMRWAPLSLRRPALLLGVPLLSFLPVADGPLADAALHPRAAVALQAAVLLAYLWVVSRSLVQPAPVAAGAVTLSPLPDRSVPERWRRRMLLYRFLVAFAAVAPALLLYALHLHPPMLRALRLSFGSPDRVSAVQAGLTAALALLWAVVFHSFLAGPLRAHLLQDRALGADLQALQRLARRGRPRIQFYVAMLLALLSMALLIHRSLRP